MIDLMSDSDITNDAQTSVWTTAKQELIPTSFMNCLRENELGISSLVDSSLTHWLAECWRQNRGSIFYSISSTWFNSVPTMYDDIKGYFLILTPKWKTIVFLPDFIFAGPSENNRRPQQRRPFEPDGRSWEGLVSVKVLVNRGFPRAWPLSTKSKLSAVWWSQPQLTFFEVNR